MQKAAATDALRRNVTTFVKQLSGTYSILVSIPWIFDIKFPDLYERVLERLALVNVVETTLWRLPTPVGAYPHDAADGRRRLSLIPQ